MSDQNKSNDGLNDADIKHLFDQQDSKPPASLDKLILNAAKTAEDSAVLDDNPRSFTQKHGAVFGLAAMVLLGVVLVPLMTKQPEYTLDINNTNSEDAVAALTVNEETTALLKLDRAAKEPELNTEISASIDINGSGNTGNQLQKSARAKVESTSTRQAAEPIPQAQLSTTAKSFDKDIATAERQTPQKWIAAINRLFEQENVAQAKEELAKFRQQYPDSEHEALLPAELRNHDNND